MGDEILKKLLLFIVSIFYCSLVSISASEIDMSKYDRLFVEISDKRLGVENSKIAQTKNPFLMKYKVSKKDGNNTTAIKKETIYKLNAIFGEKVKINSKWYRLKDKIGEYKLSKIKSNSVVLQNAYQKQELFIRKHNAKNVKFSSN